MIAVPVQRVLDGGRQNGIQAGFDERPVAVFIGPAHGMPDQRRLPQVREPVLAVEDRGVQGRAGDRRDEHGFGGPRPQIGEFAEQHLAQGLELIGIRCARAGNPASRPGGQLRGLPQRQRSQDVRGRDLAARHTDDGVRLHPFRLPLRRQRHHHREIDRLPQAPLSGFRVADSGVQDNLSDYVGALYARPGPWLDLSYRFRLGKSDLQFRRSDALASFGPAFLRFNLGYLNLSKEPQAFDSIGSSGSDPNGFDSREEVVAGVRARLTERLAVGGQTRYDLTAKQAVANQVGLIYTHPCLVLAVGFEQRLTPDAQLGDQTAFLVRVTFQNLGGVETGGGLFGS